MQSKRTTNIPVRAEKRVWQEKSVYRHEVQQAPIQRSTYNYQISSNVEPQKQAHRITTNTLTGDVNRQAAVNTAVKSHIQGQVPQRQYGYNTNSNIYQSQGSSREGRVYHYEPSTRKEFQGRTDDRREQRGRIVSSVDTNTKGRVQYTQIQNDKYQNKVYVSGSGSPGYRRHSNIQEEEYHSYTRGGIVKLRRWKYTSQTEINKIIMIQRWWRYMLLIRKERQSQYSESSEQKTEKSENIMAYGENDRYGRYGYGYGEKAQFKTETKTRKNAKEKIIAGTKNRYIVETTTIEVFKQQNTVLKKVRPEELTKDTKKIKRKTIKEQMMEIWERENVQYNTESLCILSQGVSFQTQEIIKEYEVKMKAFTSSINEKKEEIIELTKKLKAFEVKKNEPFLVQCVDEHEIIGLERPENIVEERDSLVLLQLEREPLETEYVDELFVEKIFKPENEIQLVDQMEIYKIEKPENQIEYAENLEFLHKKVLASKPKWKTIVSDTWFIKGQEKQKPISEVEERDSIILSSIEKEPLETEYIDELFIEKVTKPENEIQIVDQMEILKAEKPENEIEYLETIELLSSEHKWTTKPSEIYEMTILRTEKPENKVEFTNEIKLLEKEKPENEVEERDSIILSSIEKEPLETEYIDELFIEKIYKPENEIQIVDQMEILKDEKPENEIENVEELNIPGVEKEPLKSENVEKFDIYGTPFNWNNLTIENESLTILREEKPENEVEERDSIILSSMEKEPLETEYIDEIKLEENARPENEIQIVDQMEIKSLKMKLKMLILLK